MNKLLGSAPALAALLLTSTVFAQGYVGGAGGISKIDVDCSGTATCDTSSNSLKLFGGFRFANNFAAELTYIDWGKANATGEVTDGISTVPFAIDLRGRTVALGAAYFAPIATGWEGVVRLGLGSSRGKAKVQLPGASVTIATTSTQPYLGLGIGYRVMKNVSIDGALDFSRFKLKADAGGVSLDEKADVRTMSIGASYTF